MKLSNRSLNRIIDKAAQSHWDQYLPPEDLGDYLSNFDSSDLNILAANIKSAYDYFWAIYEDKIDGVSDLDHEINTFRDMLKDIARKAQELAQ